MVGIFQGLWAGVSDSVGKGINSFNFMYADKHGLIDKKYQQDLKLKELESKNNKMIITAVVVMIILIITLILLKRK